MMWLWRKLGMSIRITITKEDEYDGGLALDLGPWEIFKLTTYVTKNYVRPNENATYDAVRELVVKEALRRRGFKPQVL